MTTRKLNERAIAPGLLLAMPQLDDPNFSRAVILMIEHESTGSFGLIVNRPSQLGVGEVMQSLEIDWKGNPDALVWNGGPVMPHTGWLLHSPVDMPPDEGTLQIAPGLMLSTSPIQLQQVAAQPPLDVRFLMGYSGWSELQLESELATGSWLCADASRELIFDTPAEEMWAAAVESLGVDPLGLVQGVGVH